MKRVIPIRVLIPNAITIAALCAGLTSVRLAIAGDFDRAILAIVVAGVLDGIDGRVARLLKGASRFGAELDSLSDVTAFGVAPALVIYLWTLEQLPGAGWIVALAHAVCCALRLARFNANLDVSDQPHKKHGFLTGIPAPVGAGLTLSPMFLYYWLEPTRFAHYSEVGTAVTAVVVGTVAFLMVSNLPTYSWKSVRIRPEYRIMALVGVALFAGALLSAPYMTLSLISVVYAATIPMAILSYRKVRRQAAAAAIPDTAEPSTDAASAQPPSPDAP
ncbi:MAG: phosphatidylcholine/phosphatidylserine synthase [Sphingosinicella sp.]|nr:phosphatidylcholine/phosphatidylserine synthase [Sphingosinicella sp.]